MSIANWDEATLRRFIGQEVARPDVVPKQPTGHVSLVKDGVPSDEDFSGTPQDGTLALDNEAGTLYVRAKEGEWLPT